MFDGGAHARKLNPFAGLQVEKLWQGFVLQSDEENMRLPTFWGICEAGSRDPLADGHMVHASLKHGKMMGWP